MKETSHCHQALPSKTEEQSTRLLFDNKKIKMKEKSHCHQALLGCAS
jgi:hypothetical protein